MVNSELDRVREDLASIRAVTGIDLPFDRFDVRGTLVIGCCALLPAAFGLAGVESRWLLLGSAAPFLTALLGMLWRNWQASHPSRTCPHEKRKEYRVGVPLGLVWVPLLIGFHAWATKSGAPPEVANGSIMIFLGLMLLIQGLEKSDRRAALFPAIAAIIGGLSWPYFEHLQVWTILWSCTGIALLGAAAVMHRQLVIRNQQHDRAY
jgi:hypothetical protein